ncbi:hypothetical protein [Verrucosispora sp. NA02020]|uniref:hypothetical protein n=1 Tax=Verrucosispora sp. NA02020 TaxID=2742132 RepID=UPI001591DBD9|nr:hypothetical protein [Verrucosispora sp. NA02020]QKW15334.1 hypothetical protein HUT12_22945 [Verrucosispora sp. NA02020]
MPDLAQLEAARTPLPFTTARAGYTVTRVGRAIYLNAREIPDTDALDLSIALARAVHENATEEPR